jgi:hypothetical protein
MQQQPALIVLILHSTILPWQAQLSAGKSSSTSMPDCKHSQEPEAIPKGDRCLRGMGG